MWKIILISLLLIIPGVANAQSGGYNYWIDQLNSKSNSKDEYNLSTLGATLDNSTSDKQTIQTIYNSLATGSTVLIPVWSSWDFTGLTEDPTKHITWDVFNVPGYYPPPPGDGDTTLVKNNGYLVERKDTYTKDFNYPLQALYWNDDSIYTGPWSNNWQQLAAAMFRGISGDTANGNTSAIQTVMDSYGNNPSGSYDVNVNIAVNKYGRNSNWGIVDDLVDFSGKSAGAFSLWNEYDLEANGEDVKTWDPSYGVPQAGHRSVFFISNKTHSLNGWNPSTDHTAPDSGKGTQPHPDMIAVVSSDGNQYVWYTVQTGTTGTVQPIWPVPTHIVGTISSGVLTVDSTNQTINVDDWVTGETPLTPVQITKQLTGTAGGAGTYSVSDSTVATATSVAMYSVPRITDGTVVWQFGEEYDNTISSGVWFSGGNVFDTAIGIDKGTSISNAFVDTELATFQTGTNAVPIRIASDTYMDFTGNGTLSGRNKHTLGYSTYEGTDAIVYNVSGGTKFYVKDNGTTGVQNIDIFGSGITGGSIDFTGSSYSGSDASAIRLAPDQLIDFSASSSSGYNQHTLQYSDYEGANILAYQVKGATVMSVTEKGDVSANTMNLTAIPYASLPSAPIGNIIVYCSDCYSSSRPSSSTQVGIPIFWGGNGWFDMVGGAVEH